MDAVFGLGISVAADLSLIIKVNDVPFAPKRAGELESLSIPIHAEVVPGENILEVLIGTADVSPEAPLESVVASPPEKRKLDVQLRLNIPSEPTPGTYITKVENLDSISWAPDPEDDKIKLPQKLTIKFTAPMDHSPPSWQNAEVRSVSDLRSALTNAHIDIIGALKSGNADAIGQMTELAYRDAAIAYPIGGDKETRRQSDVDEIRDIISDPDMTIPNLPESLDCKSYARGRLFECFAADGEAPVRILFPGEEPIYFTFRFSVIDNKLRIVR